MLNPRLNRSALTRIPFLATAVVLLTITLPLVALRVTGQSAPSLVHAVQQITAGQSALIALVPQISSTQPLMPGVPGIQGTVVRWGTNDPISYVDVELTRVEGTTANPLGPLVNPPGEFSPGARVLPNYPNPADIWHVRTGADGKFSFTKLHEGKYRLLADRAGGAYSPADYGQRNPRGPGFNFDFKEGQSINDLKLPMAGNGTISGRILEADGTGAAHVRVLALEASYLSGRRLFGLSEVAETDDHGEYRLYYLPPGRYFVGARPEDQRRRFVTVLTPLSASMGAGRESFSEAPIAYRSLDNGEVVEDTFAMVYYGGDTESANARPIDLLPGASINSIDISLASSRVHAAHVRGIVFDGPTGKPAAGTYVRAYPQTWNPSIVTPSATTDANGGFDISGLGPGSYFLGASASPYSQNIGDTAAIMTLEVGESNIDNVRLVMTSGISIRGRVSFEGAAKNNLPDIASLRAGMTMDTPSVTTWDSPLPVGNSGPIRDNTFTISGIQPGSYRLGIRPILSVEISPPYNRPQEIPEALANMYVKSARLGGQDALSGGVLIGNETRTEFDVVIGTNGGIVDGVVLDSRLQPVPNSVAVLIPASVALRDRTDLYKSVTTDETGRFKLRGIAPGDYKVFAFDYAEPGIWKNPDFIRPLESRSKSVSVSEGSNVRVDLSLTEVRQ